MGKSEGVVRMVTSQFTSDTANWLVAMKETKLMPHTTQAGIIPASALFITIKVSSKEMIIILPMYNMIGIPAKKFLNCCFNGFSTSAIFSSVLQPLSIR